MDDIETVNKLFEYSLKGIGVPVVDTNITEIGQDIVFTCTAENLKFGVTVSARNERPIECVLYIAIIRINENFINRNLIYDK